MGESGGESEAEFWSRCGGECGVRASMGVHSRLAPIKGYRGGGAPRNGRYKCWEKCSARSPSGGSKTGGLKKKGAEEKKKSDLGLRKKSKAWSEQRQIRALAHKKGVTRRSRNLKRTAAEKMG